MSKLINRSSVAVVTFALLSLASSAAFAAGSHSRTEDPDYQPHHKVEQHRDSHARTHQKGSSHHTFRKGYQTEHNHMR